MRRFALVCLLALGCVGGPKATPTGRSQAKLASAGALHAPRSQFAWTLVGADRPLLGGGFDATAALAYNESFDVATGAWTRTKDSLVQHANHTLTYLAGLDQVLLVGRSVERFDRALNKWIAEPAGAAREGHTATLLASGKVLVAGGESPTFSLVAPELYDPSASAGARWSPAGAMAKPRAWHSAVLLASGKVLVCGGRAGDVALDDAELYDPATNAWTATAATNDARYGAAVARLADGRVLAVGGFNGLPMSGAEIFDPSKNAWSYTSDPSVARAGATATLLPSGRVLVAGGQGPDASGTEVFDPKTSAWSKGPSLARARWDHAAIALSLGRVLLVGGFETGGVPTATSEMFGGLVGGEACTIDEECLSSKCTAGTCAASEPPDAASPDAGSPDAAPPDASAKPVVGDFQRCANGAECASGFCVDGVCCDTACDEACHSCALPWAPGTCTLEPYGTDRKNACGVSGACVATCDGKGGCTSAASGTQCAVAQCTGPSTGVGPAVCAGAGAACDESARVEFECAPYACEPLFAACRSTCATSSECAPGFVCEVASRACVPAPTPSDDGGGCAIGRGAGAPVGLGILLMTSFAAGARRRRAGRRGR